MTNDEGWRRYIDAGMTLTQITRARAQELVRELVRSGEMERGRAQERVDDLVRRSRERSEALVQTIRDEVDGQLHDMGMATVEDIAARVADLLAAAAAAGRAATGQPERTPGSRRGSTAAAPGKWGSPAGTATAAKRTVAKKAAGTATAAKRTAAKKAAGTAAVAKRAPAKKAGVARKAAVRSAPRAGTSARSARGAGRSDNG